MLLGSPVGGVLKDRFQSYTDCLLTGSLILLGTGIIIVPFCPNLPTLWLALVVAGMGYNGGQASMQHFVNFIDYTRVAKFQLGLLLQHLEPIELQQPPRKITSEKFKNHLIHCVYSYNINLYIINFIFRSLQAGSLYQSQRRMQSPLSINVHNILFEPPSSIVLVFVCKYLYASICLQSAFKIDKYILFSL